MSDSFLGGSEYFTGGCGCDGSVSGGNFNLADYETQISVYGKASEASKHATNGHYVAAVVSLSSFLVHFGLILCVCILAVLVVADGGFSDWSKESGPMTTRVAKATAVLTFMYIGLEIVRQISNKQYPV